MDYCELKAALCKWSENDERIQGLAIVGSYARGTEHPNSDIDVCFFVEDVDSFLVDQSWVARFGSMHSASLEDWGAVKALRVFYSDGTEVEFNFSSLSWASIPVDPGTFRVVSDGIEILYDPSGKLEELKKHVDTQLQ